MTALRVPAVGRDPAVLDRAVQADARVRRWRWLLPAFCVAVGGLLVLHVLVGFVAVLSPFEVWFALTDASEAPRLHVLAVNTRLPRAAVGALIGAALGSAGVLLQAVTRNSLASPEITGVAAGAVAATLAWVAFGPAFEPETGLWIQPLVATAGGLGAALIVYVLARRAGPLESTRLVLIGVLVGGVLSSLAALSLLVLRAEAEELLRWLAGELAFITWGKALRIIAYLAPGLVLLLLALPRANLLQFGSDVAVGLGQGRDRDRFLVLVAAVALTAGAVTFVGTIGFVGFIAPHFARRWVGSDLRRLVPAGALIGACVVLVADFAARNLSLTLLPIELPFLRSATLPAGIYVSLFAIPLIMTLVFRRVR